MNDGRSETLSPNYRCTVGVAFRSILSRHSSFGNSVYLSVGFRGVRARQSGERCRAFQNTAGHKFDVVLGDP
jgi:hypothetical protein